jgi:hypothetical protein
MHTFSEPEKSEVQKRRKGSAAAYGPFFSSSPQKKNYFDYVGLFFSGPSIMSPSFSFPALRLCRRPFTLRASEARPSLCAFSYRAC